MSDLISSLAKDGWQLSDEAMERLKGQAENGCHNDIVRIALNSDLRLIGRQTLPPEINSGRVERLEGPRVLQLQKVRNISAPKEHQEAQAAPRMLRLQMTDGHAACVGLEVRPLPGLGLNTPPGTKVKLLGTVPVRNGLLLLDGSNVSVLGGAVERLAEKWELQRSLDQRRGRRNAEEGGPPPFVPFGQKCARKDVDEADGGELDRRKTLQSTGVAKVAAAGDNGEFEKQRVAAIAEVMAAAKEAPRSFGGGANAGANLSCGAAGSSSSSSSSYRGRDSFKPRRREERAARPAESSGKDGSDREAVDERALRDIVEMGFDREDARRALMENNSNLEVALNMLTGAPGDSGPSPNPPAKSYRPPARAARGRGRGRGRSRFEDEEVGGRPSGTNTLFDFVESKMGAFSIDEPEMQPEAMKISNL